MSKADDYRVRIEFSTIRAELCRSDELRTTWLRIRESYEHLLSLEAALLQDRQPDLLAVHPAAGRRRGWRGHL